MSDEAYARARARETKIWKPFVYAFPFDESQDADRKIVFGLYSYGYGNRHAYLIEIEEEDLLNLLNEYNAKMADLTGQQQILVADIALRRYLAGIDKLIHDEKMITKRAEIDAESAEMEARIAALSADQAALTTLAAKVTAETTKTTARIAELQAMIETEEVNLDQVEVEIAEKEVQSARLDLEILNAANAVLKIQLETVEAGLKLIDVDLSVARANIDRLNTQRQIERTTLLEGDLEVEKARTEAAEAEKAVYEYTKEREQAKLDSEKIDTALLQEMIEHEADMLPIKKETMEAEQDRRLASLEDRVNASEYQQEARKEDVNFDLQTEQNRTGLQEHVDENKIDVMDRQVLNNQVINSALIAESTILAEANIKTVLEHFIKKRA